MPKLTPGHHPLLPAPLDDGWELRSPIARRSGSPGLHPAWIVAGLAALGLAAFTAYALAPDVKRYMKLRNM